MRLVTTMPNRAVRMPRGLDLQRCWAFRASLADLHQRIAPIVQERGHKWGLFRGSLRCPVKSGYLRHYWLAGCHEGIEQRREAKSKRAVKA